jgi:hypothetical protein
MPFGFRGPTSDADRRAWQDRQYRLDREGDADRRVADRQVEIWRNRRESAREVRLNAMPRTIERDILLAKRRWGIDTLMHKLYVAKHGRVKDIGRPGHYEKFLKVIRGQFHSDPNQFLAEFTDRSMFDIKTYTSVWKHLFKVPIPQSILDTAPLKMSDFVRTYYQGVVPPLDRSASREAAEKARLIKRLLNERAFLRAEDIEEGRRPGYNDAGHRDQWPELDGMITDSDDEETDGNGYTEAHKVDLKNHLTYYQKHLEDFGYET